MTKLSRDTQNKRNTVSEILKYIDYVGTVTAGDINKVIFGSESGIYLSVKALPTLEALVIVGQLTKCETKVGTFYSIAK